MLLALTIRAAATPQMVNRFLIFIAYSSPGWFVNFLRRRTAYIYACSPLVASDF
jgi:hypothetical protein